MKKTLGIIALIAAISFAVSCGGGGGGGDPKNPDPKTPAPEPESMIEIEMVEIPAGVFWMGSPASPAEPNREANETQHEVVLTNGFKMGKYPVTQEQYEKVMGASIEDQAALAGGDLYGRGKKYPMYYVNWYDAVVFCNKLSVMENLTPAYSIEGETDTDKWIDDYEAIPSKWMALSMWNKVEIVPGSDGYRLPTEAQWEYACRGDYPNKDTEQNTNPFGIGDGTKITWDMANFNGTLPYDAASFGEYTDLEGTYLEETTPVGYYGSANTNSYGLYDMHGNVAEWCWDWYGVYSGATEIDPQGPAAGSYRVLRGGAWISGGKNLRSAYRPYIGPNNRYNRFGFRLVRPL